VLFDAPFVLESDDGYRYCALRKSSSEGLTSTEMTQWMNATRPEVTKWLQANKDQLMQEKTGEWVEKTMTGGEKIWIWLE
jgi:hypothetical protein